MKKANLACAPLPLARITSKFGAINLTRLQAKFDENLKFESKFCGADDSFKFDINLKESKRFLPLNLNPKSLKFDEEPSKFSKRADMQQAKPSQNKASDFSADFHATPSKFKPKNQKERTNK